MLKLKKRNRAGEALNLYNRFQSNVLHKMRRGKGEVNKMQNYWPNATILSLIKNY